MIADQRPILDMNAFDRRRADGPVDGALARRLANVGASSVLFYQQPLEMVSADGAWMQDADGRRYLDCYNNVLSVGHCHPRISAAIAEQSRRLNINTRYLNRVVDDYLDALKSRLPADLSNVALTCTGSEANDLALRVARKVTARHGIVVTESAYHGNTSAVTDISPSALGRQGLPDHVVAIPAPSAMAYGDDVATGLAEALWQAASQLDERGHGFAGFICDSIFSSDGVFGGPAGFLAPAIERVHSLGGLYIADEVQPGFARSGSGFWGYEHHGVAPDIVTMGKPMGNGYPMAGMATRPAFLERFCEDVGYFNTFGGNPVAAAAGHAVLHVIEEEGLQQNARRMGEYLHAELLSISQRSACIAEVRQEGLFIGIEIGRDADRNKPDPDTASTLIAALCRERVLLGAAGKYGNVLKIRPPLCLSSAEADFFLDALSRVLSPR